MKMSEKQDPPCDAMQKLSLQPSEDSNSDSSSPPCSASTAVYPVHSDASVVTSAAGGMPVSPAVSDCSRSAVVAGVECIQEGNSLRQRSVSEGTQTIKGILKHRTERCYSECDDSDLLDLGCSSYTFMAGIKRRESEGSASKKTVRFCEEIVRGVYFTNVVNTGKSRTQRLNRRRRLRRMSRGESGAGQSSTPNSSPRSSSSGSRVEVDVDLGLEHQVEPGGWRASSAPDPEQCPTIEENARLDSTSQEIGRRIANSRFRVVPVQLPCTSASSEQAGSNPSADKDLPRRMGSVDSGVETMSSSSLGGENGDTPWP
ncbi:hypothetical protein T4D_8799 [Trichinella pseudospiralis]|uniref:Uncharacterized protein n=2 Tax=Trichinella pseudospiralis TaxID=6337 RepID=A0A0V1FLB7_TRIPS|nr:hypothetical protein T4D_8799 [Trichinella pseudospiralis]